jgi:hypothetical protein
MRTRLIVISLATAVAAGGAVALLAPTPAGAAPSTVDGVISAMSSESELGEPKADGRALLKHHKRLLTREQRRELRTTGHLTVTKDTKKHGTVTVAIQLGEVTAVSPTSVTVKSRDGYVHSYAINDKTKVRVRRAPAAVDDLSVGMKAAVLALVTADGDQARRVIARPAAG